MDASRLFTVEYSPRQGEWRIDPLNKTLKANYESFLRGEGQEGISIVAKGDFVGYVQPDDWMLLGVCSSSAEAGGSSSTTKDSG